VSEVHHHETIEHAHLHEMPVEQPIITEDTVPDQHGHETHSHVHECTTHCEHNHETADHLADKLFSEPLHRREAHGHEHHHDGPHVCQSGCEHDTSEASTIADTLFDAEHRKHDHHEVHAHHDHVCGAECHATTEQADDHARDLFDHKHEHGGHGPECAHCYQTTEQATQSADEYFAHDQKLQAETQQQQITRARHEAIASETNTVEPVTPDNNVITEPRTIEPTQEPERTIVVSHAEKTVVEPELDIDIAEPITSEEVQEHVPLSNSVEVIENVETQVPDIDNDFEADHSTDSDMSQVESFTTATNQEMTVLADETVVILSRPHPNVGSEQDRSVEVEAYNETPLASKNEVVADVAVEQLQNAVESISTAIETVDVSANPQIAIEQLRPILVEMQTLLPLLEQQPAIVDEMVIQLKMQLETVARTMQLSLPELIQLMEAGNSDVEQVQLLYEILHGLRRTQSIEWSQEFSSRFTTVSDDSDDTRTVSRFVVGALRRLSLSYAAA